MAMHSVVAKEEATADTITVAFVEDPLPLVDQGGASLFGRLEQVFERGASAVQAGLRLAQAELLELGRRLLDDCLRLEQLR